MVCSMNRPGAVQYRPDTAGMPAVLLIQPTLSMRSRKLQSGLLPNHWHGKWGAGHPRARAARSASAVFARKPSVCAVATIRLPAAPEAVLSAPLSRPWLAGREEL